MNRFFNAGLASTFAATMIATHATALPLSEIKKRDFNNDGFIERGPEIEALKDLAADLSAPQTSRLGTFLSGEADSIPVNELDEGPYYLRLAERCKTGSQFVLQENVTQLSLNSPDAVLPSKDGALFSLSHDRLSGQTDWKVAGALAWVPKGASNRCLLAGATEEPTGAALSAFALAPYISFNGTGDSTATGTSDLSFGVLGQFQVFGGAFDLQEFSIAPYFRTDFQGDAEVYGLTASWKPYHFESRLNGLQGDFGKRSFDWSFGAQVNYLTVQKGGNSGLVSGTEHAWAGFDLGAGYTFSSVGDHGLRLSAGVSAYHDVSNSVTAVKYDAAARLGLSKDNRTSLELLYEKGKDRLTMQDVDGVTLNLRLSF